MVVRTGRDGDFDLGMGGGERGQQVGQEGAFEGKGLSAKGAAERLEGEDVLHPPGAAAPVAVVEVEPFALQDKCADAILGKVSGWYGDLSLGNLHGRSKASVYLGLA